MDAIYKNELNIRNILRFINPEMIYRRYLPSQFEFNYLFSSPFRKDINPSFIIGGSKHNYRWKDFTSGESDDCFGFVMKLFSLSFDKTLERIVIDLGIASNFLLYSSDTVQSTVIARYENAKIFDYNTDVERTISIKVRDWNDEDIEYWDSMGVSKDTATKGRVVPIEYYFVNKRYVQCSKLTFAFGEHKDDIWSFKIYNPTNKNKKWISYNNRSVIELWHLLPKKGRFLVITSSRKDSLAVIENLNIPSIAFQGESVMPKPQIMEELKDRFDYIFIFYDNDFKSVDNWGQIHSQKLIKIYPYLINIKVPDHLNSKDYSDLNASIGRLQAKKTMQSVMRTEYDNYIARQSSEFLDII